MRVFLISLCAFSALLGCVSGGLYSGYCPEGKQKNYTWDPSPGTCQECKCTDDKNAVCSTCGVYSVPENCTAVTNKTLPYPDCCFPEVECPDE